MEGVDILGYVRLYYIISIENEQGDFIDRPLSSGISFTLLLTGAGGIINGAAKNGTAFKPVRSF